MKILVHLFVLIMAAGVGLGLGFALRGKKVSAAAPWHTATPASTPVLQARSSRLSGRRIFIRANDDSPLATKLARDLSMSAGVTKWLLWLEAIEKAAPTDFPRLYQLAQGNAAATRLVSDRWIELHPRHVFDTLVAAAKEGRGMEMRDLADQLFRDWPRRDPDAAIAALSGPEDFPMRNAWRSDLASAVIQKDAERGLRLFHDWHIENLGPFMNGVRKWAAADPRHAAEFALANQSGYVSQLTMEAIGKEWAGTDPRGAMEFALGKPGALGNEMAAAAMKSWTAQNLSEAADWLAHADRRARDRLSPAFVEAWAKTDSEAALTWCESNLTGSALAQAVRGVVKGVAQKDVAAAAALVNSLNPSPARAEAAGAVAGKWFPDFAEGKTVPPEALKWLASLDSDSAQRVVSGVTWGWSASDPKSMAAFLSSSSERFPMWTYDALAREMARKNPMETLNWAKALPEDRGLAAGATAFAEWQNSQSDAAMKWLDDLPSGDARYQPYLKGAIRSIVWNSEATTLLARLSTADQRATALNVIEEMKLPEERRAKLLDALKSR